MTNQFYLLEDAAAEYIHWGGVGRVNGAWSCYPDPN